MKKTKLPVAWIIFLAAVCALAATVALPAAAERPVEVDPVRADVQRVNTLLQQYGFMLKFHQIPISSISAASSSAETLASSSS